MKKTLILSATLSAAVTALVLLISAGATRTKPEMPIMLSFSAVPRFENQREVLGQKIDLSRYDLHERFDREITNFCYMHSSTLLMIKRANRIFPLIDPILKEMGVPQDLKYLCCIESTLNPRAVSPAKAAGLWQFMPATGKEYGLEVNENVDERFHIEKATRAACKMLKSGYEKFGDWWSVVDGYNGGMNGIARKLDSQHQKTALDLYLVDETSRYAFRIMACKEIMRDPYHYGFVLYSDQLYRPIETRTVTVTQSIEDLASWAVKQGSSYMHLKEFNPWLRSNRLPVRPGKEYQILLPKEDSMYYDGKNFAVYDPNWVVDL